MSILVGCPVCHQYYSRRNSECPRCQTNLSSSKKFRINVPTPQGGRITKTLEGNLTLARKVEAKIKNDVSQEKYLEIRKAPLISDIWAQYEKWAIRNKKSSTDDICRWDKHIKPHVDGLMMDRLFPRDVEKIISSMVRDPDNKDRKYAPATVKHVLTLISRVYNWSIKKGLYGGLNPASKVEAPKINNQVTECLTRDELERLHKTLSTCENRSVARVVSFALYTGFRLNEILGLEWNQISRDTDFVFLPDPKGKPATIPLCTKAQEIVLEAKNNQPYDGCSYVFPKTNGDRRKTFSRTWGRIRADAGLPAKFRFHGLRHTFASYLASSGEVDLYTLQKLLNHQDAKMTQRYAHLLDGALRRGINVADKVFGDDTKSTDD
jgi:integrase